MATVAPALPGKNIPPGTEDTFVREVQKRTALPSTEEALLVCCAILRGLGGCLTVREAAGLAEQLPPVLAPSLEAGARAATEARMLTIEQFESAVSQRAGCSSGEAAHYAAAVLAVLRTTIAPQTLYPLRGQIPVAFEPLLGLSTILA